MTEESNETQRPVESDTGNEEADQGKKQRAAHAPDPETKLIPRQMRVLEALVCNPDVQAASAAAGVGRTTVYRWLQEPAFQNELRRQRDAVLSEALVRVKTLATRAATELADLLNVKDERLRRLVCNDILGHSMKIRELEDFENRLTVLEKAMSEKKNGSNS